MSQITKYQKMQTIKANTITRESYALFYLKDKVQNLLKASVILFVAIAGFILCSSPAQGQPKDSVRASLNLMAVSEDQPFYDTRYVSLEGSDRNSGKHDQPWRTVQHAVDQAAPGTVIQLGPGIFHERVLIGRSGREGAPIIIEGTLGADGRKLTHISGGNKVDPSTWKPAPEVGENVYSNMSLPYEPHLLTVDGKYIAGVRSRPGVIVGERFDWQTFFLYPENKTVHPGGWGRVPVSFWETMGGIYSTHEGVTYIRLSGGGDPRSHEIVIAPDGGPRGEPGGAVISIHNVGHITIRNLKISSGDTGILVSGRRASNPEEAARHVVIENCFIEHGRRRIHIASGARNVAIRDCHLVSSFFGTDTGPWMLGINSDNAKTYSKYGYFYEFLKAVHGPHGITNDNAIRIDLGCDGVLIEDNIMDSGGIGVIAENSTGLIIRNNIVKNFSSVGIALLVGSESKVFDNKIIDNSLNMRLHRLNDPNTDKPFRAQIYRNLMSLPMDVGIHTVLFSLANAEGYLEPEISFYHNTLLGGMAGLSFPPTPTELPKLRVLNNVFDSDWSLRGRDLDNRRIGIFDYNWIGGAKKAHPDWPQWTGGNNIVAEGKRIWSEQGCGALPENHPARNSGVDLSQRFSIKGFVFEPLPGMERDYYYGKRPDMGAVQHKCNNSQTSTLVTPPAIIGVVQHKSDP